jgi:hypothetical protein
MFEVAEGSGWAAFHKSSLWLERYFKFGFMASHG